MQFGMQLQWNPMDLSSLSYVGMQLIGNWCMIEIMID